MAVDLAPFPNAKRALLALLGDLAEVGTEAPAKLASRLPFIRVTTHGGRDNTVTDRTRVDVDCFAASEHAADDLGEAVRQRLTCRPHVGNGFVLDLVETLNSPQQVPWTDNPPPWRSTAAYTVSARR